VRTILTVLLQVLCFAWFAAGCYSGDGGGDGSNGGGSAGECANISGSWTIEQHCEADLVGGPVEVTQSGCDIEADWGGGPLAPGSLEGKTVTIYVAGGDSDTGVVGTTGSSAAGGAAPLPADGTAGGAATVSDGSDGSGGLTCTGTVGATSITVDCEPDPCHVVLAR
jgi:hypothetical protein